MFTNQKARVSCIEQLESRVLLSLSIPVVTDIHVEWSFVNTNSEVVDRAHFQWHDDDPTGTTYVSQWSESASFAVAHDLGTPTQAGNYFEVTQILNAGQKDYYRVKAVVGGKLGTVTLFNSGNRVNVPSLCCP